MKQKLRLTAALLALACLAGWFFLGSNRGWTRTTETRMERDPVTEIEFPVLEKRFSPGLELLGVGLLASVALAAGSMLVRSKPN